MKTMKTTGVAGAILATAVALAFSASALNAADAPSASTQAAQIKCLAREFMQRAERLQDRHQRLQGQECVRG